MGIKKISIIIALSLLAAGCNPFATTLPAGIIKSTNGGADWQFANTLKNSQNGNLSSLSISKMGFDPGDRQIIYAGSFTGGLYKSTDSAASWSNILSKIYVYDFAIDQINPKIIYAAGFYADHGRLLKTTDGGASWNQIYNEESANNPVRDVAINPFNSNQLVIGTASGDVVRSSDGGLSWQLAKNFNNRINRILWQGNNIYVLLQGKGLFKSTDFGGSFVELTAGLNKVYHIGDLSYSTNTVENFSQVYVDFTVPSLIYLTTSQNVYKSVDEGTNWILINLPVKPTQSPARAIAVGKTSSNIVFTSVGSTIYKSLDGGNSWQTQGITSGGYVNAILIDPQLPQIVYAGIYAVQQ